jgi:paraquat-inducible protein B
MKEEQAKEDENKSIVEQANTLAKSAGLDMDFLRDEKGKPVSTIDYDLFWAIVSKTEPVGKTVEDRINWVINEVKKKRTDDRERIINQQKILSDKQKKAQDKNKVLEKGVKVIPEKEKDEVPLSMAEALSRIERRV